MKRALSALTAAVLTLALTACASNTRDYPSLARRPVEWAAASTPGHPAPLAACANNTKGYPSPVEPAAAPMPVLPASPPAPTPPDASLIARLAGLVEQASTAHQRFAARRDRAERAVTAGHGAAEGSEAWALASIALADLESARSDAMIALADLDQLYAAARIAGGDSTAIAAARDRVSGWIGEEDGVLATLRGRLGG